MMPLRGKFLRPIKFNMSKEGKKQSKMGFVNQILSTTRAASEPPANNAMRKNLQKNGSEA